MGLDLYSMVVGVISSVVLVIGVKTLFKILSDRNKAKMLALWSEKTRGSKKIIVHCFPGEKGEYIINPSPFVVKLLAFLRMAKLDYEIDATEPMGPNGKMPWISVNGENKADSQLIIDYLIKKHDLQLNGSYTEDQLAVAEAARIMTDEHMIWGAAFARWVEGSWTHLKAIIPAPSLALLWVRRTIRTRAKGQGIGLHSMDDLHGIISKDIRVLSKLLGQKKFFLGDEPCVADATFFGHLAQYKWGLPDNHYLKLFRGECKNLDEYCERMRAKYFPEWKPKIQY